MGVSAALSGFCFRYFHLVGAPILKFFPWLPSSIENANLLIHPVSYASVTAFLTIISFGVGVGITYVLYLLTRLFIFYPMLIIPIVTFAFMVYRPVASGTNRASSLETEVPYAAAYISVMATGGISPFKSLEKLADIKLLPRIAEAAKRMSFEVKVSGSDPVAALYSSAKSAPSKDYRDLVSGYASTLSSGGDVTHFLLGKTQGLFDARAAKMRGLVDRISMLMEGFITVSVLLTLGIYSLFIVSKVIPAQLPIFGEGSFVLFAYVLTPLLSAMFLYLGDLFQPRYPISDLKVYKTSAIVIPILVVGILLFILPFTLPILRPILSPGVSVVLGVMAALKLPKGFEISVGLALTFLATLAPGIIIHRRYTKEAGSIFDGLIRFQRDMVEIRKTGLGPEKCIQNLAARPYGGFSKHLQVISNQISWGLPLSTVYKTFAKNVRSWLAQISAFLLVDAIDVGGGSPETLETLAAFGERMAALEKEKVMNLRPLMFIPYLGGIILIVSTLILLSFMGGMAQTVGLSFNETAFIGLFVPPLFIHALVTGLVAGKIAGSRVSGGFLHAFILVLIALLASSFVPTLSKGFGLG